MTTNAIGIDLGTTHCCVAVYQNHKPKIISNSYGKRTTPSWVAFNETECLVGDPAKTQAVYNPENTIYDMKRLIGQRYEDSTIQSDIANWPFKVFCCDGMPKIAVMHEGVSKAFKPEEISAIILKELKKTAEEYLEAEVTKAVITVPAYFSDYQRQATMDAAKIAGLEVLRLLNEPTAAAIACVCSKIEVNGTLLVVDIGGGTLDVSIVVAKGSAFTVKATKGNTHLGGEDFTNNLMDDVINLFKKKHNKDLKSNKRALYRLRHQCEVAKRMLSYSKKAPICVDSITDGIDLNEEISKCQFEAVNSDLFNKILETVKGALTCGNIRKEDIDKVIMVGGSSNIPKIRTILENFFDKPVYAFINPDETIAAGAGIYAAVHGGIDIRDKERFTVQDIIPTSLGVGILPTITYKMAPCNKDSSITFTCKKCTKDVKLYCLCCKCNAYYHPICVLKVPGMYIDNQGKLYCCDNITSESAKYKCVLDEVMKLRRQLEDKNIQIEKLKQELKAQNDSCDCTQKDIELTQLRQRLFVANNKALELSMAEYDRQLEVSEVYEEDGEDIQNTSNNEYNVKLRSLEQRIEQIENSLVNKINKIQVEIETITSNKGGGINKHAVDNTVTDNSSINSVGLTKPSRKRGSLTEGSILGPREGGRLRDKRISESFTLERPTASLSGGAQLQQKQYFCNKNKQ